MKKISVVSATLLITLTASALLKMLFPGYGWLKDNSPEIIIVRCVNSPPPPNHTITSDVNIFSTEIVAAIKGTNCSGVLSLSTEQWLSQGNDYLIFGKCENGTCRAIEDFRVIPLGRELSVGVLTNAIVGKSPDEQLQILFKRAIYNLDRQIKKEQEAKQRLEAAVKK